MKLVTVHLLLDVDADPADVTATDAVNEILREQLFAFDPRSSLVDYAINAAVEDVPLSLNGYNEGDFHTYLPEGAPG